MTKCPQCGATLNERNNCDYCGYHDPQNIKQVRIDQSADIKESLEIINDNLNTLHDLHQPTIGDGIKAAFRILFAIYTLGIVLLFWKKPRKRLDKSYYKKVKKIIQRNIKLLKVSTESNAELSGKLNVLQNELDKINKDIKKSLLMKQISFFTVLGAFIILIATAADSTTYNLKPNNKRIEGKLSNNLIIKSDSITIKIENTGDTINEISTKIEFEVIELAKLDIDEYANLELSLIDSLGEIWPHTIDLKHNKKSKEALRASLLIGMPQIFELKFTLEPKQMKDFPANLKQFKINSDVIKLEN